MYFGGLYFGAYALDGVDVGDPPPIEVDITIVDVQSAAGPSPLPLPAFDPDPEDGDTILVGYAYFNPIDPETPPTDSAGNTYELIGTHDRVADSMRLSLWIARNIDGATALQVTATLHAATQGAAVAWCLRGVDRNPYNLDVVSADDTASGTTPVIASGLSTPVPARAGLALGLALHGDITDLTDGAGWNRTGFNGFTTAMQARADVLLGAGYRLWSEYKVSASAENATWGAGTFGWVALVASVRVAPEALTLTGTTWRIRRNGLTIRDVLNDSPSTCDLTVMGAEPTRRMPVRIAVPGRVLFAGALQTIGLSYVGRENDEPVLAWACSAIDDTEQFNRKRPFGTWTDVSATTVAEEAVAAFAPGFHTQIQAGLPLVSVNWDGSEGFNGAFSQLARLIGGYWRVEDGVVHLFQEDTTDPPDAIDMTPGRFLDEPHIDLSIDTSQQRTRVTGKGHAEALLSAIDNVAGSPAETILPVSNAAAWFGTVTGGGKAISDTQVFDYTGVQPGGAGSLVGPSVAPVVRPLVSLDDGGSLTLGDHRWVYVWGTAAGKSLPSPLSVVLTAQIYTPPTPQKPEVSTTRIVSIYAGTHIIGATYEYMVAFATDGGGLSALSPVSDPIVAVPRLNDPTKSSTIYVVVNSGVLFANPLITQINVYRSENGGAFELGTFANVTFPSLAGGGWPPNKVLDISNGTFPLSPHTGVASAAFQTAKLAGVAIGPVGVTYREIYQTEAGGTQLKLQQTIANNTATTATASAADGALGANAPTADTSGLTLVTGHVLAGSDEILTASTGPFDAAGGWALVAGMAVRYTGFTGNTLTGIPADGVGALLTTIAYGEHIDPAPALIGVTGIVHPLLNGAPINIWVQRDDLAAQADQAALDLLNGVDPADGIIEGPPVVDERRGEASLAALLDAHLELFARPIQTVVYACRDIKSKSGSAVVFDLVSPPISGTLVIQDVTIDQINQAEGVAPRFTCTATSVRFSLEDVLRRLVIQRGISV